MIQARKRVELAILEKYIQLITKVGANHMPGLYFYSGVIMGQILQENYPELDNDTQLDAVQAVMVSVEELFSMGLPMPVMVTLLQKAFEDNTSLADVLAAHS